MRKYIKLNAVGLKSPAKTMIKQAYQALLQF